MRKTIATILGGAVAICGITAFGGLMLIFGNYGGFACLGAPSTGIVIGCEGFGGLLLVTLLGIVGLAISIPLMREASRCRVSNPCQNEPKCWACRKAQVKASEQAQADRAEYERYQALQEKFSKDKPAK